MSCLYTKREDGIHVLTFTENRVQSVVEMVHHIRASRLGAPLDAPKDRPLLYLLDYQPMEPVPLRPSIQYLDLWYRTKEHRSPVKLAVLCDSDFVVGIITPTIEKILKQAPRRKALYFKRAYYDKAVEWLLKPSDDSIRA